MNTGINLHDTELSNAFFNMTPKAQATKLKIEHLDFITNTNYCSSKETIKKMRRQRTKQEGKHLSTTSGSMLPIRIFQSENTLFLSKFMICKFVILSISIENVLFS